MRGRRGVTNRQRVPAGWSGWSCFSAVKSDQSERDGGDADTVTCPREEDSVICDAGLFRSWFFFVSLRSSTKNQTS